MTKHRNVSNPKEKRGKNIQWVLYQAITDRFDGKRRESYFEKNLPGKISGGPSLWASSASFKRALDTDAAVEEDIIIINYY